MNDSQLQAKWSNKRDSNGTVTDESSSGTLNLYEEILRVSEEKKMSFFKPIPGKDYRTCTLTEGKIWYITYYAMDPVSMKLKRFRIKLNRIASIRERRRTAREMMNAINQRLVLGWNPITDLKAPRAFEPLYDAFNAYLNLKKKEMEFSSFRTYSCLVTKFKTWLKKKGCDEKSCAYAVTPQLARLYLDYIEENMSAKSYNNQIGFLHSMFSWMKQRGFIENNPFDGIKKKPKKLLKKNRRILEDSEIAAVVEYLEENNREYLAIVMLCYCCLMRPKEIAMLKCSDIDLERQTVRVSEEIAKNDHTSYRTIPDSVMPLISSLDYSHPDWYLFGAHDSYVFTPSKTLVCSRKIAKYWDYYVRRACGFGMEIKFYSLKDTGVTNMLSSGVPINFVQQQADHSSVAMTAIYVGKKSTANSVIQKVDLLKHSD